MSDRTYQIAGVLAGFTIFGSAAASAVNESWGWEGAAVGAVMGLLLLWGDSRRTSNALTRNRERFAELGRKIDEEAT